jgi:hypothetical protein
VVTLMAVTVLVGACATQGPGGKAPAGNAPTARPQVLTVPHLQSQLQEGEAIGVILSEIESSGTVYRLTTWQRENLRGAGMPLAVLGYMQNTYDNAIRKNPDLAKSDERWIKIGDYWYGGLPAGWPRDWVVGAPNAGQFLP